jgi:hypothetical protein
MWSVQFYDDAPMRVVATFACERDARDWVGVGSRPAMIQRVEPDPPQETFSIGSALTSLEDVETALADLRYQLEMLGKPSKEQKR